MSADKPLKISIAMATYNGGKYLQEQLDSHIAQIRLPEFGYYNRWFNTLGWGI